MGTDPSSPSQRRPLSHDLVYSEADMFEFRQEWIRETRERSFTDKLSHLSGQLESLTTSIPAQMEAVARRVVSEVLAEEARKRHQDQSQAVEKRWTRGEQLSALFQAVVAGLMAYLVLHH